jgi:CRP-like cAMP-binding protein
VIERHLAKLRARDEIDAEEEAAIRGAISECRDLPADHTFIRAGEELRVSTLLLDGLICRYKDLSDGQRQITELHVPGDFADLHSFTLKRLDHNIMTLTPSRVALVPHENLTAITERYPHLTRVFWFLTNLDAAIHREWVLSLGRRSAVARMAHLFCELFERLRIVGLTVGPAYSLGLTQEELAECLGITSVHANRTLQDLRSRGLIEFRAGRVTLLDAEGLRAVAEFDPGYLYLEHRRQ